MRPGAWLLSSPTFLGLPLELKLEIIGHLAEELTPSMREITNVPSLNMIESEEQPSYWILCGRSGQVLEWEDRYNQIRDQIVAL